MQRFRVSYKVCKAGKGAVKTGEVVLGTPVLTSKVVMDLRRDLLNDFYANSNNTGLCGVSFLSFTLINK